MTTYCDVNTCEDCPRYGDDCDGDKRVEYTDLIRRADAIEAVASITMSIHLSDVICDKLLALPSADAVHGEWIWRTDIPIGDGRTSAGYICSNCGKDYWHGNVFNYCPSCGARMYKGGDDE